MNAPIINYNWINVDGEHYNMPVMRCIVDRMVRNGTFTIVEGEEIDYWIDQYQIGGAMPSGMLFRCPHGNTMVFLQLLKCIWLTHHSTEESIEQITDDEEVELVELSLNMDDLWDDVIDELMDEDLISLSYSDVTE